MGERVKLVEKFRREGERAAKFFDRIGPEDWDKIVYAEGEPWLVRDVLAHIVDTEAGHIILVKNIIGGGSGVSKGFDIDEFNAMGIATRKHQSPQDLITEFGIHRKNIIDLISRLSEDELAIVGRDPYLGEVPASRMLRLFYLHVNAHIRELRKVIG
jgi:hypothetical protein